jgi:hypothetical protein
MIQMNPLHFPPRGFRLKYTSGEERSRDAPHQPVCVVRSEKVICPLEAGDVRGANGHGKRMLTSGATMDLMEVGKSNTSRSGPRREIAIAIGMLPSAILTLPKAVLAGCILLASYISCPGPLLSVQGFTFQRGEVIARGTRAAQKRLQESVASWRS